MKVTDNDEKYDEKTNNFKKENNTEIYTILESNIRREEEKMYEKDDNTVKKDNISKSGERKRIIVNKDNLETSKEINLTTGKEGKSGISKKLYNSIKENIIRKIEQNLVDKKKPNKAEKCEYNDVNCIQKLKGKSAKTDNRSEVINKSFNII